MRVNSIIKLNTGRIKELTQAQTTALEQTIEALHTEIVQAQIMPFDTGNLQNESTFADISESNSGKVSLVHDTAYARRLYYHPEYDFNTDENPGAGGEWYKDYLPGGEKEDFVKEKYVEIYKRIAGV